MLRTWHRRLLIGCILVACLAGAWVSGQLLEMHDGGGGTDGGGPGVLARLCKSVAGGGAGCEGTVHGAWSQITITIPALDPSRAVSLGKVQIPVAFAGLAYFVAMGTWFAIVVGPQPSGAVWHRLALAAAILGGGVSAFFLGLMAFGAAPWCIGCVTVHVLNLILMSAAWALCVVPDAESETRPRLRTSEACTAVVVASIFVAGLYAHRLESLAHRVDVRTLEPYKELVLSLQADPALLINAYLAQPRRRIEPRPSEGNSGSRRHLVVFTDFQCDLCYLHSKIIREDVLKEFGKNLDVWLRHFPLCTHCNDQIRETIHPDACRAAFAAETAQLRRGQVAFEFVCGLLFANRKQLSDTIYRSIAAQIAVEPEAFLRQMDDPAVRRIVRDDVALGRALGVDGTPTLFLDGRRVPPLCMTPEFWKAAAKLPDPPLLRPD